jgi:hypothetical protein
MVASDSCCGLGNFSGLCPLSELKESIHGREQAPRGHFTASNNKMRTVGTGSVVNYFLYTRIYSNILFIIITHSTPVAQNISKLTEQNSLQGIKEMMASK